MALGKGNDGGQLGNMSLTLRKEIEFQREKKKGEGRGIITACQIGEFVGAR